MPEPWVNPRSRFYWFRRRVPKQYRQKLGLPAEIKFSLETTDKAEAEIRCAEENIHLERQWRSTLANAGKPADELSHLQIVALAGEFYRETVAKHREEPGPAEVWEKKRAMEEVKHRRLLPPGAWLPIVYGAEARKFLEKKGVRLGGKKFDSFLASFLTARREVAGELALNASGDYSTNEQAAARYPKFKPVRKFETLWKEFCSARRIAASTRKKWKPYFEQLIRRLGSDDMGRVTEQHLIDWRDALLPSVSSPVTVKDEYVAAAKSFFDWAKRMKKVPVNPAADVNVDISGKHGEKKRGFTDKEAALILSAALAPMGELMTAENAAARRWCRGSARTPEPESTRSPSCALPTSRRSIEREL